MSHISEHCSDCVRILGDDFRHVHIWLDEFFATKGAKHRVMRHHVEGVEEVRRKWGDRAARAAEIHIMKDCYGQVPSKEQAIVWHLLT
jgi:DNA-binding GntR family transcriptional regulator